MFREPHRSGSSEATHGLSEKTDHPGADGANPVPAQSVTDSLEALARLRNVFVIKTLAYAKPTVDVDH
jgi:hypothetical protein